MKTTHLTLVRKYVSTLSGFSKALCVLFLFFQVGNAYADWGNGARYLFTLSDENKAVEVIDLKKMEQAGSINLDHKASSMIISDALDLLVVGNAEDNSLGLFYMDDPHTEVKFPVQLSPDYLQLSALDYRVAIYDKGEQKLAVIDLTTGQMFSMFDNVVGGEKLTFDLNSWVLYSINEESGSIEQYNFLDGELVDSLDIANPQQSLSTMTRSLDGLFGYISNKDAGEVVVVDLRTFKIVERIKTGKSPLRPWGTADGRLMVVANAGSESVSVISTTTKTVMATWYDVKNPVEIKSGWLDTVITIVTSDNRLIVKDRETGKTVEQFELPGTPGDSIITSDSVQFILPIPSTGEMLIVDLKSKEKIEGVKNLPIDIRQTIIAVSSNACH